MARVELLLRGYRAVITFAAGLAIGAVIFGSLGALWERYRVGDFVMGVLAADPEEPN